MEGKNTKSIFKKIDKLEKMNDKINKMQTQQIQLNADRIEIQLAVMELMFPENDRDNITASFGYLFEGLQHCQIACPADYFGFVTKVGKNTTDVDTNASSWGELAAPQEEGIVDMGLRMYQEYYEKLEQGFVV